jgi:hypothetical protein
LNPRSLKGGQTRATGETTEEFRILPSMQCDAKRRETTSRWVTSGKRLGSRAMALRGRRRSAVTPSPTELPADVSRSQYGASESSSPIKQFGRSRFLSTRGLPRTPKRVRVATSLRQGRHAGAAAPPVRLAFSFSNGAVRAPYFQAANQTPRHFSRRTPTRCRGGVSGSAAASCRHWVANAPAPSSSSPTR